MVEGIEESHSPRCGREALSDQGERSRAALAAWARSIAAKDRRGESAASASGTRQSPAPPRGFTVFGAIDLIEDPCARPSGASISDVTALRCVLAQALSLPQAEGTLVVLC